MLQNDYHYSFGAKILLRDDCAHCIIMLCRALIPSFGINKENSCVYCLKICNSMCYGNVILLWCLLNGEPPTEKENIGKKSKKKFYILTFKCFHMLWCRNPHLKQMEFEWSYNGLAYLRSTQLTFVYT